MSRAVAAGMIVLYQRHVSPRKGFGCPMRVLRGRNSCAEFARRAVRRVGVFRLLPLMRRRFVRCAAARKAAALTPQPDNRPQPLDYQTPRPPPDRKEKRRRWGRRSYEGSRWTMCDWCHGCDTADFLCCPLDLIDCGPTG
jgi:putative component of membrane protein insertase Oxa1/YidC/SpoIIIJ protein YidD